MKKFITIAAAMLLVYSAASAQSVLGRIADRAKNAAENAVSNKIENAIYDGIDKATSKKEKESKKESSSKDPEKSSSKDGWTCPECGKTGNTGNFCEDCGAKKPGNGAAAAPKKKVEAAYAKSDFVPGDEIIFDDDFADEQIGVFPSKWDLISGVSEVVKYDGQMTFDFQDLETRVAPLMKNPRNYLSDEFTIECDFYAGDNSTIGEDLYSRSNYRMEFYTEDGTQVCGFDWHTADSKTVSCDYTSTSNRDVRSDAEIGAYLNDGEWNHLSISFNNRFKGLLDQDPGLKFEIQGHCDSTGSAATNDKLSQQRAEAIVARLVELGISADRLTAVGKGSHEPIADNGSDEGRAKNRRVEFVKK